jgi:hypothetical protein
LNLSSVVSPVGNLVPLAGILYRQWDPFQFLMLRRMETVIVAGFALFRLRGAQA